MTNVRYKIREAILHTRFENEAVLLNLESGRYYSMNAVGSRIWSLLSERPRTLEELLTNITDEYQISREAAGQDIQALIQDLVKNGLLEPADERTGL